MSGIDFLSFAPQRSHNPSPAFRVLAVCRTPPVTPDVVEQDAAEEIDNIVPTREYDMLPMVGLGESAGSTPALQGFFKAMPEESGIAFVLVVQPFAGAREHSPIPSWLR